MPPSKSIEDSPAFHCFQRSFSLPTLRARYALSLQSSRSQAIPVPPISSSPLASRTLPTTTALKPVHLQIAIDKALDHAWAPGSCSNHRTAISKFCKFCDDSGIPQSHRLPASEWLLCAFIASQANRAPSTLKNYISGLRAWHITNDVPWQGSVRLQYVRDGVSNISASVMKAKPPRPPVTCQMLETLHQSLDRKDPKNVCILACADTAFWGQCRLGEILHDNSRVLPNPLPVPSFSSLHAGALDTQCITLPFTKVKGWDGEIITLTQQTDVSNPVLALADHLRINKSIPSHWPLFSYLTNSTWMVLTKTDFLLECNKSWAAHNLPRYTGHSFRIGGTTALLLGGVHPDIVKEMGRWSSSAYNRYWRDFHLLIPLNAQNIPNLPTAIRPPVSSHHSSSG